VYCQQKKLECSSSTAERSQDSMTRSGSAANAPPDKLAAPIEEDSRDEEAPPSGEVGSSHILSQPSQHLNIGAMSTSDPPQGATAQGEDIVVDADVCPLSDRVEIKSTNFIFLL
jgi:hypothetical protein